MVRHRNDFFLPRLLSTATPILRREIQPIGGRTVVAEVSFSAGPIGANRTKPDHIELGDDISIVENYFSPRDPLIITLAILLVVAVIAASIGGGICALAFDRYLRREMAKERQENVVAADEDCDFHQSGHMVVTAAHQLSRPGLQLVKRDDGGPPAT
jgi:hypothetical protein